MMEGLVLLEGAALKRLERAIDSDQDIMLYLGEWLMHLSLFSDAQIYDILRFVKPLVESFNSAIEEGTKATAFLSVADSRWISFTGMTKYWDTEAADEVDEIPHIAVTHIFCDMLGLKARIAQKQGRKHGSVTACT